MIFFVLHKCKIRKSYIAKNRNWSVSKVRKGSQQKCQKYFFFNVWRKIVFDICFTGFGTALTTILPILLQYCYEYCYNDSRNLWAVMKAGDLVLSNLIQPTISLEMPVPSQGHYGFHSFPVVDLFCLFIYLWVLTFPL